MTPPRYTRPTTRELIRIVRILANSAAWANRMERACSGLHIATQYRGEALALKTAARIIAQTIKPRTRH